MCPLGQRKTNIVSKTLTVTKTKNNNTMSNTDTTENLDNILNSKFVQELLRFVSALRTALGDENGELDNDELVARAKEAYKK